MTSTIEVVDRGRRIAFSFEDILRYHGPGSPGGVAHAFKVLQRALPLLDPDRPCERREIVVETAFAGPGARDAFEMVTRAVTDDRFRVDHGLARPESGRTLERFVFRLSYRDRCATLALREGFVTDEFIELARTGERSAAQERRLDTLKREMADRVMARPAGEVYDASESVQRPDGRSATLKRIGRPTEGAAMAGELTFFELGVEDSERGRVFYEGLFGWTFETGPDGSGWVIRAPNVAGGMHRGDRGASPYVFFGVDDMDTALERVRELGGTVEEMDVGGDEASIARFGRFKICRDDQGSPFGLHQPPSGS